MARHLRGMKRIFLVLPLLLTQVGGAKFRAASETLPLIDDLNDAIQQRLLKPMPKSLGMTRIMIRPSFGEHFLPLTSRNRDFAPENDRERKVVAALEDRKLDVGLYLFGESILSQGPELLSFRALKGPGAITANTPRPNWYPSLQALHAAVDPSSADPQLLPDWRAIYPVAQRAMRSFKDGGNGFEMEFHGWTIAARPAIATSDKCVACHNNLSPRNATAKVGESIGGVMYAFRPAAVTSATGQRR